MPVFRPMATPDHDARNDTAELLAAAGITVTTEGKARARRPKAKADERWTPEK